MTSTLFCKGFSLMWKKINSKVVFEHPRITLVEDMIELPNRVKTKYIYRKHKGNAVTIICKDNNKILLQKEYSYPPNKTIYQFPGGGIGLKENPQEGANRELMEEFGHRANSMKLVGEYLLDNRKSAAVMYVLLATELVEDSLDSDDTEILEHNWFSEQEIENMIKNGELINPHLLASWSIYKANS